MRIEPYFAADLIRINDIDYSVRSVERHIAELERAVEAVKEARRVREDRAELLRAKKEQLVALTAEIAALEKGGS